MRQKVILYINGKRHEISGEAAFQPLSHYLRYTERLTGTKVVCAEGDCGACTVLKSQLPDTELIPINSCITIPALLDGSQLITIEGLEENTQPHPVQDAMIQNHGAQCGFCTPGIICSLASYFETHHEVTEKKIRNALTGNLCRCTGYEPILKSALAVSPKIAGNLQIRYLSDNDINQELLTLSTDDLLLKHGGSSCFAPINLPALLEYKKDHPEARIVASATDIGVMVNKGKTQFNKFCTLNRILDCSEIKEESDAIVIGATASLSKIQKALEKTHSEFFELLKIFASPQIKNVATLAGNIANASPIADTLPFLFVMNAEIEIQSHNQKRNVNINDFYLGYKKIDLRPEEVITAIIIPKIRENEIIKLHKVSRRKDLDISCVTAAYFFEVKNKIITKARIAYGGVGPTVLRLPKVESFFQNQKLDLTTLQQAGEIAALEVNPLTDVRGSREYRLKLVKNLFLKTFYE